MADRENLIDLLMDNLPENNPWDGEVRKLVERLLANGVVVREKGEWGTPIKVDADNVGYKCSQCGEFGVPCWRFCPNCGADMRKGEDG